jgi:ketosteroid isomerase-like protein
MPDRTTMTTPDSIHTESADSLLKARSTPGDAANIMTPERLREFGDAWNRGDVDELMTYMTDDCVYSASVGPEPGRTFRGREQVRRGFSQMLAHDADGHPVAGPVVVAGDRGSAEWAYRFPRPDGTQMDVRGCDLFQFRGDLIVVKDAFRKTLG